MSSLRFMLLLFKHIHVHLCLMVVRRMRIGYKMYVNLFIFKVMGLFLFHPILIKLVNKRSPSHPFTQFFKIGQICGHKITHNLTATNMEFSADKTYTGLPFIDLLIEISRHLQFNLNRSNVFMKYDGLVSPGTDESGWQRPVMPIIRAS